MTSKHTLTIDVTSDALCPFCLLGMKQLQMAIERYRQQDPSLEVQIRMHPFQLNGLLTDTPEDRLEWAHKKFGKERYTALREALKNKFKTVGIEVHPAGQISSSHRAHRLEQLCGQVKPAAQADLAMDIMELNHVHGIAPSDVSALARIGVKHGVFSTQAEGEHWLSSSTCDIEVCKSYQKAQRQGITGVPFFVFADKYAASGAMGVDQFVDIIDEIFKRETSPHPTASADQCMPATHKAVAA